MHGEVAVSAHSFVQENFDFYGKTLTGATELRPRWKRCVDYTDQQLGEALGRRFVDRTFGAEGKQRTLKMVARARKGPGPGYPDAPLDDARPPGRRRMDKLKAITNKIGYPGPVARLFERRSSGRDDAIGNGFRADHFEFQRELNKIGKPVDRLEWEMTPPTVNAYYDPQMNNINFPAGILQPPFFDNNDGRRREFRRHRHGDRPRADPRLRRPRPPVRRPGQPEGLVDSRRTPRNSNSAPPAWPKNIAASPWPPAPTSTAN